MKKYIVAAAAALCIASSALAQSTIFNNPDNKSYFGVRAALDISCPSSKPGDIYKNGAGFSVGTIYNTPIVANLYFEPGVNLYYNTWGMKDQYSPTAGFIQYDTSFRNFGLEVPIIFGYHFDFTDDINVAVFTGPAVRFGFVNQMHFKSEAPGYKMNDYENVYGSDGLFERVDCAWKFGAAVNYSNYYLGVSGEIGIPNLYNDSPDNVWFHQNTVSIALGYNF